jgi:hypothetical protein
MFIRNLLLAVLLSAVLLFAAAWAAGAKTPVNGDEPIVMTKAMYADLLCMASSDYPSTHDGGVQFAYNPSTDVVKATYEPAMSTMVDPTKALAIAALRAKERANTKVNLILSKIRIHVSPNTTSKLEGF